MFFLISKISTVYTQILLFNSFFLICSYVIQLYSLFDHKSVLYVWCPLGCMFGLDIVWTITSSCHLTCVILCHSTFITISQPSVSTHHPRCQGHKLLFGTYITFTGRNRAKDPDCQRRTAHTY